MYIPIVDLGSSLLLFLLTLGMIDILFLVYSYFCANKIIFECRTLNSTSIVYKFE